MKRITGRELIGKILDHPEWLDLPVHVLVMDDGEDGGFLNTVEADRFEVDGPDVLSLISEKPAAAPAELREDPYAGWREKQRRALYEQTPPPIELDDGTAAPVEPREDTGSGRG